MLRNEAIAVSIFIVIGLDNVICNQDLFAILLNMKKYCSDISSMIFNNLYVLIYLVSNFLPFFVKTYFAGEYRQSQKRGIRTPPKA